MLQSQGFYVKNTLIVVKFKDIGRMDSSKKNAT